MNSNIIKEEIYKLAKEGSTVIFSTHRMEQVEEICDQIVLVNRGKKILDGTVKSVKHQFKQNLFKVGFADTPPTADSGAFEITKRIDNESLVVRINEGHTPNDVLNHYLQQNASIVAFNELLPSLNEIFIQLVEGTPTARQFQHVPA